MHSDNMKTIYFDKKLNLFIDDISNKKSLKDIKNEFGIADYQIITVDDSKEHVVVIDNILQKKHLLSQD